MVGGMEAAAELASGAVVAHAIDGRARGNGEGHGACLNCGTPLAGAFCHSCGQVAHIHRTLGAIGHDILHGVFHFEGRTWHTLPLLAWKPGDLTRRYVHGQRARFVSPLALFLFSVFLMFAVFHSVGGPFRTVNAAGPTAKAISSVGELAKQHGIAERDLAALETSRNRALASGKDIAAIDKALEEARDRARGLAIADDTTGLAAKMDSGKPITIDTGIPALDHTIEHASRNPELLIYKLQSNGYKYSWLLIPISLPFIWLAFFWRRDVTLYDHAIFAIHSLTFMTLLVVVLSLIAAIGVGSGVTGAALIFIPPIHMYRHLRGAYLIGRFGAIWRTLWLLISASIVSLAFLIILVSMEMSG